MAAWTQVYIRVRDVSYSAAKVFTETELVDLRDHVYDALDAVTNLVFQSTTYKTERNDNTPSA